MSSSLFVKNLIHKQRSLCKNLVINSQLSRVKNEKFGKVSDLVLPNANSFKHISYFSHKQTYNQAVKYILFPRNFSTSNPAWSSEGSNQDSEKRANYIYFGVALILVLFTVYMNLTMEHTQDKVFIKLDDDK